MQAKWRSGRLFGLSQRLGRSLMLPIAALPVAALLVRFGQPDMLGMQGLGQYVPFLGQVALVLRAAGNAVMDNLPLIFAVGVAIGFARKSDGSTGLAAVVGFLTYSAVVDVLSPFVMSNMGGKTAISKQCLDTFGAVSSINPGTNLAASSCAAGLGAMINYGPLGGTIVGIVTALLWQRFYQIKFPSYLGFFAGRRFVPIVSAAACIVLGLVMAAIYPAFNWLLNIKLGHWLTHPSNTVIGGFIYGFFNRLLVPFGLHHLLNTMPWFNLGKCTSDTGMVLTGDVPCFFSGEVSSFEPAGFVPGAYMTGLFPIVLGGLLGAALAMYQCVSPPRRKAVGALFLSAAGTCVLTGITEPVEFAFAFVAPPLLVVHALLTGSSFAIVNALGIRDGYSFSAGAIDYGLNFTRSAQLSQMGVAGPLLLLVLAIAYFFTYYLIFSTMIRLLNLATLGRARPQTDSIDTVDSELKALPPAKGANIQSCDTAKSHGGTTKNPLRH